MDALTGNGWKSSKHLVIRSALEIWLLFVRLCHATIITSLFLLSLCELLCHVDIFFFTLRFSNNVYAFPIPKCGRPLIILFNPPFNSNPSPFAVERLLCLKPKSTLLLCLDIPAPTSTIREDRDLRIMVVTQSFPPYSASCSHQ